MIRRLSLVLVASFLCASAATAQAKETISFAYLLDPAYEAVVWPIQTGKVTSATVDVKMTALDIPALLQATGAKTYDVIMTAAIGVPLAKAHGLNLEIMATALRNKPEGGRGSDIFVRADSPYHTLADLKGKTIGNYSLPSTGTTLMRIALAKKGFNVSYEGGDFNWVQMPAAALPGALATGRIDAATLAHSQAFLAQRDKTFRVLASLDSAINKAVGGPAISAILASYPDKLAARPAAFKEFERMIKASNDYTRSHVAEVAAAMSEETKLEPAYFGTWLKDYYDTPMTLSKTDLTVMTNLWKDAKGLGIIKSYPDIDTVVWPGALRQ